MKNKLKHILYLSFLLLTGINAWASWSSPMTLLTGINAWASWSSPMTAGDKRRQAYHMPSDVIQAEEPDSVITRFPVARTVPRNEDELDQKYLDLRSPENIKADTVYDAKTNTYIIGKRVGDGYLSAPIIMTAEEYQQWTLQKSLRDYYRKKNQEAFDSEGKNMNHIRGHMIGLTPLISRRHRTAPGSPGVNACEQTENFGL